MVTSDLVVASTTFAEKSQASEMAKTLLAAGVAACVQIDGPIESHYCWEGKLCHETEWRLSIKTSAMAIDAVESIVHQHHPYDLPQWIVVPVVKSSAGYREWVAGAVKNRKANDV